MVIIRPGTQAREITETLGILDGAGGGRRLRLHVRGAIAPFSEDPTYDLDMSALSVVETYAGGRGMTYPDMPWEPKESFKAVAACYARAADQ